MKTCPEFLLQFPPWKVILIVLVTLMGALFALPNVLSEKQREIIDLPWTEKDQRRFDRIAKAVKKLFTILPEDKRYMEPGRSMMIKAGMIDGKYKEPKLADAYNGHGESEADTDTTATAQSDPKDGGAEARRAAGCPF